MVDETMSQDVLPDAEAQRGAALVEFAILAPVLILLIFGALEYGLLFKDYLSISNTTRAGARVGSAAGSGADTDWQILQAVKTAAAALPSGANSLDAIVVYRSSATGGAPPATCLTGPSAASGCNRYVQADLTRPVTDFGCAAASPDRYWCPTTRSDSQSAGPDYVGVWVQTTHGFVTKLFGTSRALRDSVTMRIEPKQS